MTDLDKKISCKHCGPGGIKCVCCGPAPGKDRKAFRRQMKRGPIKQFHRREIEEQTKE